MPENNKNVEFLQKLAPCIERGELETCVEEAARVDKRSCDVILSNTFQGKIEDAVRVLVNHITKENILVLGIGERVHGLLPKSTLIVPHLSMPLYILGFNHLLIEALFTDISSKEWAEIYRIIDGELSSENTIDIKISTLRKVIENNPTVFPILNLNLQKLKDKDGLVGMIIVARELGIHLYGIYSSDAAKLTSLDRKIKIRNDGLAKAIEIINLIDKAKSGKLMILSGDAHVACVPLKPTAEVKDTAAFMFGDSLFRDFNHPYLNLTLLVGTKDDILKEKDEMAGWQFYLRQYEDRNFKIGDAKLFFIRDENQHRILFIYNSPLRGNNKETAFSKDGGEKKRNAFLVSREAASESVETTKENVFSRLFKIK